MDYRTCPHCGAAEAVTLVDAGTCFLCGKPFRTVAEEPPEPPPEPGREAWLFASRSKYTRDLADAPGSFAVKFFFPPPKESMVQVSTPMDAARVSWIKAWDAARSEAGDV
jgi:hypothetical protein